MYWQTDKQTDRKTGKWTDRYIDSQTDRKTESQTDRYIGRQIDRQTDRQTDRNTVRQIDRHINRQTERWKTDNRSQIQADSQLNKQPNKERQKDLTGYSVNLPRAIILYNVVITREN